MRKTLEYNQLVRGLMFGMVLGFFISGIVAYFAVSAKVILFGGVAWLGFSVMDHFKRSRNEEWLRNKPQ